MVTDFWRFWFGQTVSAFGTSFTQVAVPLLIFKLTGSPLYLAASAVAFNLPYLFFGLAIGAWTDRQERKRTMIATDLGRAALIASVPLAAAAGVLSVWWIYAVTFLVTTLAIAFEASEFGAVPSLVERDELVSANGRIQASFAAASVLGPLSAGALFAFISVETLLLADAATFLVSAASIAWIARPLNAPRGPATSLRADIVEGLRYVLAHPVLRNISLMMALINFVGTTTFAQLVLFAKQRYAATDAAVSVFFAAGGAGVLALSLAAGWLRRRWSFGNVALGALMANGVLTVALSAAPWYPVGVVLWGVSAGCGILFNINTGSLRQAIVPERLLGRIITIAMVLAWSANPLGALAGGIAIELTRDVTLVYAAIGVLIFAIALAFRLFSPLGHAERFIEPATGAPARSG